VPSLFDSILDKLLGLPTAAVYGLIGALAAVENVFPPIPADTAVAIGAFLSHHGTIAAPTVFLVTWLCNVLGATAVYLSGRTLGRQFFTGRLGRQLLKPVHLRKLEGHYERHGPWGIFLSRFLPGVRAVVPAFAGVARLSAAKAVIPMAIASGIWYGTLTLVVASAAGKIEEAVRIVTRLNWTFLALALAAIGLIVWKVRGRSRTASGSGLPEEDG
jgi:membrane protein DedA with SNARE-associated domain